VYFGCQQHQFTHHRCVTHLYGCSIIEQYKTAFFRLPAGFSPGNGIAVKAVQIQRHSSNTRPVSPKAIFYTVVGVVTERKRFWIPWSV
jgi:hypothetical protein